MLDAAPFKVSAACCWCRLHVAACSRLACCCSAKVCRVSSASVAKLSANGSISAANCSAFRACLNRIIALTVDCLPIVLQVDDLGVCLLNLQCSRSAFGLDALGLHLDHVGADVNLRRRVSSACLRITSAPTWSRWRPKASRPNAEREHWRLSRPTPRSSTYSTIGRQSTVSAIMRLRQARNAEQLAAEIEPLALSLATLADETRQTLAEQQQASREQAATWSLHQQQAAETLKGAAS